MWAFTEIVSLSFHQSHIAKNTSSSKYYSNITIEYSNEIENFSNIGINKDWRFCNYVSPHRGSFHWVFTKVTSRKSFQAPPVTAIRVENLRGWAFECYRSRGINGHNYPVTCRTNGEQVAREDENGTRERVSSLGLLESWVLDIDKCCTRDAHSVTDRASQVPRKKKEMFTDSPGRQCIKCFFKSIRINE